MNKTKHYKNFFICLLLILCIGIMDYNLGVEYSTSVFYLLPIAFISRQKSNYQIVFIILFCSLTWLLSELLTSNKSIDNFILSWNFLVRVVTFVIVSKLVCQLRTQSEYYHKLADTDQLTDLLNRRGFLLRLEEELLRSRRFNHPFTLGYIDIDNFKHVNDTMGHQEGDRLLVKVSETLKYSLRTTDYIARMGGDEFSVLLVETDSVSASRVFDKCFTALKDMAIIQQWPISFSIGVVTYTSFQTSLHDIIKSADNLMYSVKKNGKNNIIYQIDHTVINESASH